MPICTPANIGNIKYYLRRAGVHQALQPILNRKAVISNE